VKISQLQNDLHAETRTALRGRLSTAEANLLQSANVPQLAWNETKSLNATIFSRSKMARKNQPVET